MLGPTDLVDAAPWHVQQVTAPQHSVQERFPQVDRGQVRAACLRQQVVGGGWCVQAPAFAPLGLQDESIYVVPAAGRAPLMQKFLGLQGITAVGTRDSRWGSFAALLQSDS